MICPKCKTEVSDDDVFCPNCNLKLIFNCPKCKAPTHLGPVSCEKCGYTFVKLCPKCHSRNFAWSPRCKKCGTIFAKSSKVEQVHIAEKQQEIEQEEKQEIKIISQTKTEKLEKPENNAPIEKKQETIEDIKPVIDNVQNTVVEKAKILKEELERPLLFYIDFINMEKTFEKYNKEEFKQKVIQNIKTTIKIAFATNCDFVNSHCVMFQYNTSGNLNLLKLIEQFELEFLKFNQILEKTLNNGLTYKFAITTEDEVREAKKVPQLKYGSEKDIIVSNKAYTKLSNDLSLIKISSDSYKMVFLEQKPAFQQSEDEKYDKALELILNNLADNDSKIRVISLSAPRGVGKTHLLNDLCYKLSKANHPSAITFYAQCSALTQISPYGLIQSFFISLFECPIILDGEFNLKAFERRVLEKLDLDKIDDLKLETLANLIYPLSKANYEEILENKELTYKCLRDVFEYIKKRKKIVFVIDDFDLIDESSYGFLKYLVDENYFTNDAKMILGYKNQHSVSMYFQTNKLNNANCLNISLKCLNTQESKKFIKRVLGENCIVPEEILSQIAYNAQGNIAYIEQILQYLFERKILIIKNKVVQFRQEYNDIEIPSTLEKCFEDRLEFLKTQNQKEYLFLNIASLLGDRLDYHIIASLYELSEMEYFDIILKLEKKGYLKRKFDDVYSFKNSLTWSYCYIRAKEEALIKEDVKKLLMMLGNKIISTPLICPILAQIIGDKELAYKLWTESLRYANYIGDINIYAMAQKQSLILLESVKIDKLDYTKNNICERLGKLIYEKNPSEAKDYLTNVIVSTQNNLKKDSVNAQYYINKIIDLSGYLTKSAYLTQDYTGAIEIIDNVLKYFETKDSQDKKNVHELKLALLKARKLDALLSLGSWEEIAILVHTEINPILQKVLKNPLHKFKWITYNEIFYIWLESNIILAQSYSQQGSPLALELISEIENTLAKEKDSKTEILKVRLAYAAAMANTAKGNFDESDMILQDIVTNYSYMIDAPCAICQWNIISLINKILRLDLATIKDELFEATAYANNCGDEVSKNLLKTLLSLVLLEEKSYLKAIEIATSEMQFFSTKKIAFGALLAWYVSAAATAYNKADLYCIEICEKAVKICENAQNNNHYFKILFQELLAKSYLKLNDKENAKMYCDMALQSAMEKGLQYLQLRLSELKVTIARENLSQQNDAKKVEYAQGIIKLYLKTIDNAKKLNLEIIVKRLERDLVSFKAHCQLNRIIEEK